MKDPVICVGDGNTYERTEIENYLKQNNKSPVTGAAVDNPMLKTLIPNNALKGIIEKFKRSNPHIMMVDAIAYDSGLDTGHI